MRRETYLCDGVVSLFLADEVDEAHLFGVGVDVSEDLTVGDVA